MAPQSNFSSKIRNLDWFRKVPRCARRAMRCRGPGQGAMLTRTPRCVPQ